MRILFFLIFFLSLISKVLIAQEGRIYINESYSRELRDSFIKLNIIQQDNIDTFAMVNFTDGIQLSQFCRSSTNYQFILETDKYYFVSNFHKIKFIDSDYEIRVKRIRENCVIVYYNLILFEKESATFLPIYIKRYRKTRKFSGLVGNRI